MTVSRAMRRLLRIRNLEEEQCRQALESAIGERTQLEHALESAHERSRKGCSLVLASVYSGEVTDRLAGFEETRSAKSHAQALTPRIEAQEEEVMELRQEFLTKRIERRQAETLIEETEAREAIEAGRRGQQSLDDWYAARLYRRTGGERAAAEALLETAAECVPHAAELSQANSQ